MEIKQIATLINTVTAEVIGEEAIQTEDLTNVVEIGTQIFNANAVDAYVKTLTNHIGKVIFVNRVYKGRAPKVLMDGWEFGSVLEKVCSSGLPQATENETWELNDGTDYSPNVFYKPTVQVKFFNKKVTFEIPVSFTELQVKQSFSNATQLNAFISMLYNDVEKSMTVKLDSLIMRTINNMCAETLYNEYDDASYSSGSGVRAINLLYKYNQTYGTTLTADKCLTTPEFIRYATVEIGKTIKRLGVISTLFNVGNTPKFTPQDLLHVVMLTDFEEASKVYLQSDTYHNDLVKLPNAESVAYWQGSGTDYTFEDVSKIDVKTASGHNVSCGGVLCVMFDRDALGVCNMDRRVTANYNPKAEFYNNWFKMDAEYFNDLNENFVVFFVA